MIPDYGEELRCLEVCKFIFEKHMLSFSLAILGYVLAALVYFLDKYILKERIPHPAAYAFFVGLFGLFVLGFAPLGIWFPKWAWHFFGWEPTLVAFGAGAVFAYGLLALYRAIRESDISRVAPLTGSMTTVFVLVFSFFGWLPGSAPLGIVEAGAAGCLVAGGVLLSIHFPLRGRIFFRGFGQSLLAAFLIAVFFSGFKVASEGQNFVSALIWSRLGIFAGAVSLLLYPALCRPIISAIFGWKKRGDRKRKFGTVVLFLVNKGMGSLSYFFISIAITLGSVATVQALASVQYAFVAVFSLVATRYFSSVFDKAPNARFGMQIAVALACIVCGTVLAALGGRVAF